MRIIAGIYKGRILKSVNDKSVRPTTDRVKETIFNILSNRIAYDGAAVLDIFAGSGSLGLEALSRGAEQVEFVDKSFKAIQVIKHNIQLLHCEEQCRVHHIEAKKFLTMPHEQYDLVVADPPYMIRTIEEFVYALFQRNVLHKNGIAVIEHSAAVQLNTTPLFTVDVRKEFGETAVTFLRHSTQTTI
jgi:16S rRNA (guanine966-N2)-methyltransferase